MYIYIHFIFLHLHPPTSINKVPQQFGAPKKIDVRTLTLLINFRTMMIYNIKLRNNPVYPYTA